MISNTYWIYDIFQHNSYLVLLMFNFKDKNNQQVTLKIKFLYLVRYSLAMLMLIMIACTSAELLAHIHTENHLGVTLSAIWLSILWVFLFFQLRYIKYIDIRTHFLFIAPFFLFFIIDSLR